MSESILSLSQFKATASQILAEMQQSEKTLVLTQNGAAAAVVQDVRSYQRMQQSLAMLRLLVQGEADVQHGKLTEQKAVFSDFREKLAQRSE